MVPRVYSMWVESRVSEAFLLGWMDDDSIDADFFFNELMNGIDICSFHFSSVSVRPDWTGNAFHTIAIGEI